MSVLVTKRCHHLYQSVRLVSSSINKNDVIRRQMLEKIIRVDHAGELGASYIYKGCTSFIVYILIYFYIFHIFLQVK